MRSEAFQKHSSAEALEALNCCGKEISQYRGNINKIMHAKISQSSFGGGKRERGKEDFSL